MVTRECAVLPAWSDSRAGIRRLWAVRNAQGLRVPVHVERAFDSNEVDPAWMANRDVWITELQLRRGSPVRLEYTDVPSPTN